MRLGVLDVGSNTVHLLVVDAHRGAQPTPQHSDKHELRLAEALDHHGNLTAGGADRLVHAVHDARRQARALRCDEMLAFATSAVRDAGNSTAVLERVGLESGVDLQVLSGEDEARLTFLAVRRWLGWSAGNLICLDIGGGSLELAAGSDEDPDRSRSRCRWARPGSPAIGSTAIRRASPTWPRCASTWTHNWPRPVRRLLAASAHLIGWSPPARRSAPSRAWPAPRRARPARARAASLNRTGLTQVTAFISRMSASDLAELDGVSEGRAHQTLAGAVVAAAAMDALGIDSLELCPWALREGVILRRLDWLSQP